VSSICDNVPINRLIVVDGGSTDGTIDFLKKFPHVEMIDDSGGTRATARQKGIEAVETQWHLHVDSDVILSDDWFKRAWRLIDDQVGAIWGADVPIEKHFSNIAYAMTKLDKIGLGKSMIKLGQSERFMMHDTLIRTLAVKGIKIPKNLHIWEDEYIGRYITRKGYKFLKVKDPFCLHDFTMNERLYGFIMTGYLSKKYELSTLRKNLQHMIFAIPKSWWIYVTTRDFQASRIYLLHQILVLKGWLAD